MDAPPSRHPSDPTIHPHHKLVALDVNRGTPAKKRNCGGYEKMIENAHLQVSEFLANAYPDMTATLGSV